MLCLFFTGLFCDELVVCRMRLTPTDVSNIIDVARENISSICSSFDSNDIDLHCDDNAIVHHAVQRSLEILTAYLRLLRNACAECSCHQSVIQL